MRKEITASFENKNKLGVDAIKRFGEIQRPLFNKIRADLRRQRDIHATIRELNQLDTKELNDLDIGRWKIAEIAQHSNP